MPFADALILPIPIDHIGYGVHHLGETITLFNKLGFTATRETPLMARHNGASYPLGQRSAHIMFENTYIELSAPTGENENNLLLAPVQDYTGIHILALATGNATEQHRTLGQRYKHLAPVAQASREVDYGSQQGTASFNWFLLPKDRFPEGLVCFVEHLTRTLVFQAPPPQPNGATGLIGVTLYSRDKEDSKEKYRPFGLTQHDISHAHCHSYLRIVSDADIGSAPEPTAGLNMPDKDCVIIGLDIEVACLANLRSVLYKNRIDFSDHPPDRLLIRLPCLTSFILFQERQGDRCR